MSTLGSSLPEWVFGTASECFSPAPPMFVVAPSTPECRRREDFRRAAPGDGLAATKNTLRSCQVPKHVNRKASSCGQSRVTAAETLPAELLKIAEAARYSPELAQGLTRSRRLA